MSGANVAGGAVRLARGLCPIQPGARAAEATGGEVSEASRPRRRASRIAGADGGGGIRRTPCLESVCHFFVSVRFLPGAVLQVGSNSYQFVQVARSPTSAREPAAPR